MPRINSLDFGAREHNAPVNVLMELTHRCNLRCFHCYVVPDPEPQLTTEEVFDVLEQLSEAGTLFLTLTGGEIMLRRDLYEIIRRARELHFAVRLFTNGTLVDQAAADRIAALNPVDVGISIYGANATTHDGVTGNRGSFDRSIATVSMLVERGVLTRIKTVLMSDNIDERHEIAQLAEELGAHIQFDPVLTPKNDGDDRALEHSLADADMADISRIEPLALSIDPSTALCAAGRDAATISPSGAVLPCVQMPMPLGRLRERSFAEIWSGEEASAMRTLTMGRMESCTSCSDLPYCNPCLGLNFVETGDPSTPSSSVCRTARARRKGASV